MSSKFFRYQGIIIIFAVVMIIVIIGLFSWLAQSMQPPEAVLTPLVFPSTTIPIAFTETSPALSSEVEPAQPATAVSMPSGWQALPPLPLSSQGLLTNGDRSEYKVALTFDLCQRNDELTEYDTEIIRILNEAQAPATFFAGGLWMRDHEAQTRELAGNPLFELGNHSWSHQDFSAISSEEMLEEIVRTQQYMQGLLGYQTKLFRLPFGTYTDDALRVIGETGLYTIQWDAVSGDPDPDIDAQEMTGWVLQQVQPGSIIIMHANGRGWHTAEALPAIIQSLREQGYSLVTVSDLLKLPYP
jgi:peptidoglycan/xylan/chitin deacetylase (PgdA/CDA1 family)